jgi:hypothetical protein
MMFCSLLFCVVLADALLVHAQSPSNDTGDFAVTNAGQLAQAFRNGATSISIQSNITGLVREQLALGTSIFDSNRYIDFPEVRSPRSRSSVE